MTIKRGTVRLFTFSLEIDAPNIISCVPKNQHLVARVLPNSNLNFEPCNLKSCFACINETKKVYQQGKLICLF